MEMAERLGAILRALEIIEIEYALNGSGDSGEGSLERVEYKDGTETHALPDIPIFIGNSGDIERLSDLLIGLAENAPDGDWVNNEGGYGSVYIHPFEDDEDLQIDCDMTFREDGDYGDDDDDNDDDFVDDDLTDDDDSGADGSVPLLVVGEVAS